MALWSFSEISQCLGTSIQNISNRKSKLKSMGFIVIDENGKEKINEAGYNWLINNSKQRKLNELNKTNDNLVNDEENIDNTNNSSKQYQNDYVIELLKNQIDELKKQVIDEQSRADKEREQVKYWQDLYIKQNEEFKRLAFPPTLDTQEGNKETEQKELKKSFWQRLWGN